MGIMILIMHRQTTALITFMSCYLYLHCKYSLILYNDTEPVSADVSTELSPQPSSIPTPSTVTAAACPTKTQTECEYQNNICRIDPSIIQTLIII